jgi:serine/threonine-protein kinase
VAVASPNDAGAAESIALTGIVLAQVQSERRAHKAAVAAADEAIAIRRELAAKSGGNKGSRLAVAVGLKDVAPVYRAAKQPQRACSALREAREIMVGTKDLSHFDRENNLKPVEAALGGCEA